MKKEKLSFQIEDGIYGYELRQNLYLRRTNNKNQKEYLNLVLKLLRIDILNFDPKNLNDVFGNDDLSVLKSLTIISKIENKEIVARWLDILIVFDRNFLKEHIGTAKSCYLDVFKNTDDARFMIRAVVLFRCAKKLLEQDSDHFFEEAKNAVINSKAPYLQKRLLMELMGAFGENICQNEFQDYLNDQIIDFQSRLDFVSAQLAIESLYVIKVLNTQEYRVRLAMNYELDGDNQVSNKQANTFYPTISQTYLKGLRSLISISKCDELRKRLERKVAESQKEDFQMVKLAGVDLLQDVNIQEIKIAASNIIVNSVTEGFTELLNIPIIPNEIIERQVEREYDPNSFISLAFTDSVKVNSNGARLATQSSKENHLNIVRMFYRERVLVLINSIKNKIDCFDEVSESEVAELLNSATSPFVPQNRRYLYISGITKGFQNDFIMAAHILMPQIENSLRHIAVQTGMSMTTWEKERQHENLLGGCLEKLRPIADASLIDEMVSFLVDGNSVNFRNELLHGLMSPIEIQKYGMYLWWLSLKLIFKTELMFPGFKSA